jgi:cell division protein FtsI/penicillin-binding protein 2
MKKRRIKIKVIKNIHELQLIKQKLEMQDIIYEKEVAEVFTDMMDNFINKLKGYTFDMAYRLIYRIFIERQKKGNPEN